MSPESPALQVDSLPTELPAKPLRILSHVKYLCKFCILLHYKVEFFLTHFFTEGLLQKLTPAAGDLL